VATGAADFALQQRMPGEAVNLGLLCLVAPGADFDLSDWAQNFLLDRMSFVAVGTGKTM